MICRYSVPSIHDKTNSNINGATPLFIAAERNHLAVAQLLLENGADKNKPREDGASPLYIAAQQGNLGVVEYLVDAGVDVNKTTNEEEATPLHIAVFQDQRRG